MFSEIISESPYHQAIDANNAFLMNGVCLVCIDASFRSSENRFDGWDDRFFDIQKPEFDQKEPEF